MIWRTTAANMFMAHATRSSFVIVNLVDVPEACGALEPG